MKDSLRGRESLVQKTPDPFESTKTRFGGAAQYIPGTDVEFLERKAWKEGTTLNHKNGKWKIMDMGKTIGAYDGNETTYIVIKESVGEIHGHPIDAQEY